MNCDQFVQSIDTWARGRLEPRAEQAFDAHRDACAPCAEHFAQRTELTCQQFVDFLVAWQAHELPPAEKRTFERHVAVCAECETYLDTYASTTKLAQLCADPDDDVPDEVPEGLVQAILAARKSREGGAR